MRRKLTPEQKYFAVIVIATQAKYPMTGHMIGRQIGYVNGQPIKAILGRMAENKLFDVIPGEFMGKPCRYYWMPKARRQSALDFIRDDNAAG